MEYYVDKFNRRYKPVSSVGVGTGMDLEADGWNAKRRKIINVERGVKTGDVITLDQTITHTPAEGFTHNGIKYTLMKTGVDLDLNKHRIKNVVEGKDKTDAAVMSQIMTHNNKFWDSRNMQISRVKDATTRYDVVNYGQFLTALRPLKVGKSTVFNAGNMKISNLSEGVLPTDAAIVKQIPTDIMKSVAGSWDSKSQIITNVKNGVKASDAVNFGQALTSAGPPHLFDCGKFTYDFKSLKL